MDKEIKNKFRSEIAPYVRKIRRAIRAPYLDLIKNADSAKIKTKQKFETTDNEWMVRAKKIEKYEQEFYDYLVKFHKTHSLNMTLKEFSEEFLYENDSLALVIEFIEFN